jgi:hypothetical protein
LGLNNLIIQNLLYLIDRRSRHNIRPRVPPLFQLHLNGLPVVVHLLDDLFDTELFLSVLGDLLEFGQVIEDFLDLGNFFDGYLHLWMDLACVLGYGFPVALFHSRVGEDPDEGGVADVLFDGVGEPVEHFQWALEDLCFF